MSIQQVQTKNILELIARSFLADGQQPLLDDITQYLNRFFSVQPAGNPFEIAAEMLNTTEARSDVDTINAMMAILITNTDILYETCFDQIDQTLMLNSVLRNHLERIRIKNALLSSKIEDYMLGISNSDGYFYSFSDNFATTNFTDFEFTTCFIDTLAGAAMIPAISAKSRVLPNGSIAVRSILVTDGDGEFIPHEAKTPVSDAFDGLNNTAWMVEVKTNKDAPITLTVELALSNAVSDNILTKIEVDPVGVVPVQIGINGIYQKTSRETETKPFSSHVKTTMVRRTFVPDVPQKNILGLQFQLKKDKPDYFIDDPYESTAVYLFGFKELILSEQYFDPEARFVSKPISLDPDMSDEALIDAVSVTVEDNLPFGTHLKYYVAADLEEATALDDFSWIEILPLLDSNQLSSQIVRFDGTAKTTRHIRLVPRLPDDIKMIEFNTTNVDLAKRNPTPAYFNGFDAYRIAPFNAESYIENTLHLEEGINTTKIYYTELDETSVTQGFDFWRQVLDNPLDYKSTYGQTDAGHGFLYGADIGENGKSVYSETYLYADEESPVLLKECRKGDPNSKTWNVKMFLNGREIASLPVGTDSITVPWKFKQGKNHIVVMAEIPEVTAETSAPYIGIFDVMTDSKLSDYGTVKLDDWNYVDVYKFQTNLTSESKAFTIYNNEIVSRRKPTNNFRLTYNTDTQKRPEAVRFRVDFSRDSSFAHVTPVLDSYRLRFSYG
jgi:hypothetical protein